MSCQDQQSHEPLGFVTSAAARKLAKFYASALANEPVTPSQLFFLRQLWREDDLPLAVLRERAQLDATSATWLTDQLEKAGLIERRRNDPDRRVVRISLTSAGRALREDLEPRLQQWETALRALLLQQHQREELAAFMSVLRTLVDDLPDGDDLWSELSASWDTRLDALRRFLEAEDGQPDEGTSRT